MNFNKLKECGINVEEGLDRFSGYDAIYEKHLKKFANLDLIDEMEDALNRCEIEEAFEACHKLKSYVGNLSIPDLYDMVCDITESLRIGRTTTMNHDFSHMKEEYQRVVEGIKGAMEDE